MATDREKQSAQILLDVDGVFANFNETFRLLLNEHGAEVPGPFDHQVSPKVWEWPLDLVASPAITRSAWQQVGAYPEWWATLPVLPEITEEVLDMLGALCAQRNVLFATARPAENPRYLHAVTREWIETHLKVAHPNLVLSMRPKALLAGVVNATHLVEDNPAAFPGPILPRSFLVERPYNRDVKVPPAVMRVASTGDALQRIVNEVL